jgi:hypothetical protein
MFFPSLLVFSLITHPHSNFFNFFFQRFCKTSLPYFFLSVFLCSIEETIAESNKNEVDKLEDIRSAYEVRMERNQKKEQKRRSKETEQNKKIMDAAQNKNLELEQQMTQIRSDKTQLQVERNQLQHALESKVYKLNEKSEKERIDYIKETRKETEERMKTLRTKMLAEAAAERKATEALHRTELNDHEALFTLAEQQLTQGKRQIKDMELDAEMKLKDHDHLLQKYEGLSHELQDMKRKVETMTTTPAALAPSSVHQSTPPLGPPPPTGVQALIGLSDIECVVSQSKEQDFEEGHVVTLPSSPMKEKWSESKSSNMMSTNLSNSSGTSDDAGAAHHDTTGEISEIRKIVISPVIASGGASSSESTSLPSATSDPPTLNKKNENSTPSSSNQTRGRRAMKNKQEKKREESPPPPCKAFQRGRCTAGDRCRFSHIVSPSK